MTGANTIKAQWIRDTASKFNVNYCALQEHFKTVNSTKQWFRQQFRDYHTFVTQAYRLPGIDTGRGRGGLAQLSTREMSNQRKRVETKSPRLQAQILSFPKCKILWINCYFPCDPQLQHFDDSELVKVLNEIEDMVLSQNECEIVLSGDLNWERCRDNHFTRTVAETMGRLGLTSVWETRDVDYTHIHTDGVHTSVLDHFLVSQKLLPLTEECYAVHTGDNLSRHSPIFLTLNLGKFEKKQDAKQPPPRRLPDWNRVSQCELENYKMELCARLHSVQIPKSALSCQDINCQDGSHNEATDTLILDILLSVVEVSYACVPLTGNAGGVSNKKEVFPGWSREVEKYKQDSNASYRKWLVAGKPRQGPIHQAKIIAHTQFRYAVRRTKRAAQLQQARGLFDAAMAGDISLMKEMKRIKTGKCEPEELPDTVDGVSGDAEIADKFREVFEKLYNSVTDQSALETVEERIRSLLINENNLEEIGKVTPEIVKQAAMMMKIHKMDVSQAFSSDAILHAPDILFEQLSLVFQDWLKHGKIAKQILACALIPLLKGNKDPGNTNSYRAIASSSLILKIFERTILQIWGDTFHSDSLQFGFKKKSSTHMASWITQEVLSHYLRQGSKPIVTILDCTRAFDLARFDLIFSRALDCSLPAIVVRVLLFSYKEQQGWVRWGRYCNSETFGFSNSTRQGSVASPPFWSIYIDPLIAQLRKEGVGCHIAGLFVGVIAYCDDLILLSPNRDAAQAMIKTCETFAAANNIFFSTDEDPNKSKSKCIYVVGPRGAHLEKPNPLDLCGRNLPWVQRAEHLGVWIQQDGTLSHDARVKRAKYVDGCCKINETFYFAHPFDKITAVEKYCNSIHGSNIWMLDAKETQMVVNSWKLSCKLAWDVPRSCHTYFVHQVLAPHVKNLEVSLWENFAGFFKGLLASSSHEVVTLSLLASRDIRSNLGSNLNALREMTHLDPWTAGKSEMNAALSRACGREAPMEDLWRIPLLKKLLTQRLSARYAGDGQEEEKLQKLIESLVVN